MRRPRRLRGKLSPHKIGKSFNLPISRTAWTSERRPVSPHTLPAERDQVGASRVLCLRWSRSSRNTACGPCGRDCSWGTTTGLPRFLPSPFVENERLLVAVGYSRAAVPLSRTCEEFRKPQARESLRRTNSQLAGEAPWGFREPAVRWRASAMVLAPSGIGIGGVLASEQGGHNAAPQACWVGDRANAPLGGLYRSAKRKAGAAFQSSMTRTLE